MNLGSSVGYRLPGRGSKPLSIVGLALLCAAAAPAQTLFDLATETVTPIESLTPQSDILLTQGGEQGLATGDLNGDGQADLVIGAAGRLEPTVTPADGRVYVVFGPVNTPVDLTNPLDVDVTLEDADPGDLFGWTSLVGDFNNDGQDDLAIGALLGDGPAGVRAGAGGPVAEQCA
ncbi:MAG: FG-GAP repeat protein, partial [Acidobacteriota bacterium]